ncbi:cobalt ECF transporter T component CbiQ [Halarchaeum sp. P4]|uniref:cobalt ECF transporter T component CbiQ n=1 Tax=Halarchaeum sp. P4 TaxID=3421639 RepID=UPI003EBF43E1
MSGAVAGSVETISRVLRSFFTAEHVAAKDGVLQRRDPRVALLAITGLALAVVVSRTLPVVCALAALTLCLAWRSRVPIDRLLARSAVVPLASMLVVLPQAVLMPGDALVAAFGLAVTDAGLQYVAHFTLRVGVGVALLSLLVMTTPFSQVVAALRELGVPVALVWVVAVTYRYLFLFFDELRRLVLARNSRTTRNAGVQEGWHDARNIAGTFLLRTLERGERVGRGMRARGGARAPSPYGRSRALDAGDYALGCLALAALCASVVIRWGA